MSDHETLLVLARRYVWWRAPEETLRYQAHFLCQLMQLGTPEDLRAARRIVGDEMFRSALHAAPPGVLDARSWNFWHRVLLKTPPPPMPERTIPA